MDFWCVEQEVTSLLEIEGQLDEDYHFASPAGPKDFGRIPEEMLAAGSSGTRNDLALEGGARFALASSQEVYGDTLVHVQHEDYRGNVGTTSVRGAAEEAKCYAEALASAYHRKHALDTKIVRTFNNFGPRMRPDGSRMVPGFVCRALLGEPLTGLR